MGFDASTTSAWRVAAVMSEKKMSGSIALARSLFVCEGM
jgi:hypothetical protein